MEGNRRLKVEGKKKKQNKRRQNKAEVYLVVSLDIRQEPESQKPKYGNRKQALRRQEIGNITQKVLPRYGKLKTEYRRQKSEERRLEDRRQKEKAKF